MDQAVNGAVKLGGDWRARTAALPLMPLLPGIADGLTARTGLVLQAPPGAGKTTLVPLALLEAPWAAGRRLLVVEPRRLAARAAAARMAALLGEAVGETVGYRVRLDSRVGPRTRIEVVTGGVFIRRIQHDPGLDGVAAVLFDEVHERSLDGDLGLALCLEARALGRDDLRLVAMSATLDGAPLARLMGGAPMVTGEGRAFPVEVRHANREPPGPIEPAVAAMVRRALADDPGDVLVFLPGATEIRRTEALLDGAGGAEVLPLYGDLPQAAQDRAIRPGERRRVILATSIAETSLTIEGVRVVVDSGLARAPAFDPASGMARLVTGPVSRAAAEQRRGRAGRLAPGVCYRLWTEAAHRALPAFAPPEIQQADLAPLALELALWGIDEPADLAWLDPPPPAPLAQARALLADLGAVEGGRATEHGRRLAALGLHPRLGHMIVGAAELGLGGLACDIAALLSERDPVRGGIRNADLAERVDMLRERRGGADRAALAAIRAAAQQLRRQAGIGPDQAGDASATGLVLALAYPDRVALRRPGGDARYQLRSGRGARLANDDPLAGQRLLAVAELDGDRREARIFRAAALAEADLELAFGPAIQSVDSIVWDDAEAAVLARRQRRLGALVLKDDPLPDADPAAVAAAFADGLRRRGLGVLPWTPALQAWRARVAFAAALEPGWPDLSDAALAADLGWLAPWLAGCTRLDHARRIDLGAALEAQLDWAMRQRLDAIAPSHFTAPTGSRIAIDYGGPKPVVAIRLQELFGLLQTPTVGGGRVPVLLHLLSPAHRPVQVTDDLAGFWANSYRAVRSELRGQYPKHYWPENPAEAEPTRGVRRRG